MTPATVTLITRIIVWWDVVSVAASMVEWVVAMQECEEGGELMCCEDCPRVYHLRYVCVCVCLQRHTLRITNAAR